MPTEERASLDDLRRAPVSIPAPDAKYTQEQFSGFLAEFDRITQEKLVLEDELREQKRKNATTAILDKLIEPFAVKTYRFMVAYCGLSFVTILLDGFKIQGFSVDPDVLKYLVGSTGVTVIGLVGMVLTGIFVGARKS